MATAFPDRFYAHRELPRARRARRGRREGPKAAVNGLDKAAEKVVTGGRRLGRRRAEILRRVQDGLAQEIQLMLDEGVVPEVEDIDLCLILGAGWPFIDRRRHAVPRP